MDRYRNAENIEFSKAMHEKGRSSATQPHADRRTRRARSRQAAKSKAIQQDRE